MSVTEAAQEFENDITGRDVNRADTAKRYARWARRFEAWRPGGDPDAEMLREFDTLLEDEDLPDYPWENARGPSAPPSYAYRTRIVALSGTKLWTDYHYGERIEKEVQNIALGEPAEFDPTILDPGEIERTINTATTACDNPDCQTAMAVGYDAIMRGAEVADVRAEDVDRSDRSLYVRAKKGSEPASVSLSDGAWRKIESHVAAHPDREYLFRNAYDRAWTPEAWNQHFRRKHNDAGFHAFARHSAISNRLRQGEDFGQVYLRARHQNPATTLKYVDKIGVDPPGWATSL